MASAGPLPESAAAESAGAPLGGAAVRPLVLGRAAVGLGSNLGDSQAEIGRALAALPLLGQVLAVSPLYRAPPLGSPQPDYVNGAALLETPLPPKELLAGLKGIEVRLGRGPAVRWGPRTIDLDLLLYDNLQIASATLEIPHPGLAVRPFVLVPLADIAPRWRHPGLDRTIAELRDSLAAEARAAIRPLDSSPTGG